MDNGSIAIVGSGAVGRMLAYFLKLNNINTVLCYGRNGVEALSQTVVLRGERHHFETEKEGPLPKLWFVTVKAYDLTAALDQWLIQIPSDAKLVLLCNGYLEPSLGGLRRLFSGSNLRKGVVSRGARFAEDGALEIGPQGAIKWGDAIHKPSPLEKVLFEGLRDEGFQWDEQICEARKEKWYMNTVLNTLAGVHRLPRNGDVAQLADFVPLCHEVYELGAQLWPEWRNDVKRNQLKNKLDELIRATENNENSMARDIRLGRRTEADYLSGLVLKAKKGEQTFHLLSQFHEALISPTAPSLQ